MNYVCRFSRDHVVDHMVSCHGVQSGLPVCLVDEFGVFEIFMQNDCTILQSLTFHISPTGNVKSRSYLDRI